MDARRPKALEAGLFLVIVVLPLVFTPFTMGPFGDPKTVVLALGALLIWLGGVPIDRQLAIIATTWAAITILATAAGVDPAAGLVSTATGRAGGTLLTICCAALLVCGAGLPRDLVARVRGWLVWTGVAVSTLLLAYRLVPEVVGQIAPKVSFIGASLGNQLFAAAFVAAAMAAAATGGDPPRRRLLLLAVMTAAVASTSERSSLVLPIVALAVASWRAREGWGRRAAGVVVVLGTLALWQLVDPVLPGEAPPESALHQLGNSATDPGRLVLWQVSARAWLDRPILGWGSGATLSAYLHEASPAEVAESGRGWEDAHNLVLEAAVSTGIFGALALLALLGSAALRSLRSPPAEAWAMGVAAGLGAYSLVEPLNLVLTPLLFLAAGVVASRAVPARRHAPAPAPAPARSPAPARAGRTLVAVMLGICVALGLVAFAASTFEREGYAYGDVAALRTSLRLQPWRLSAREELAIQLATMGRAGVEDAAEEAAATIAAGVEDRPWDPNVRITAAWVSTLLNDPEGARAWLQDQLERFPGDRAWVSQNVNAPTVSGS